MSTTAIVETQNLAERYGAVNSVNKVDLRVNEGEIYDFLGPNGTGKTTTLNMILGVIKKSEGNRRQISSLRNTNFISG